MYPIQTPFRITQGYGVKSNRYASGFHDGVDFACKVGTPVFAARKGVVARNQWGKDYGVHIVQRRTFPFRTKRHLIYAHLSKVYTVPGMKIKRGELIGLSGNTGQSTGPHLHFGERTGATFKGSKPVNPQQTLDA